MTAAIAHRPAPAAAPVQLGLAGLPPPDPGLRVAIVGHLQRRGELRVSTDGRAHLVVQVLQPRDGLAFVAVYHQGTGDEITRADLEHLSERLQPGTAVVVTGSGLALDQHDGHHVLRVLHCNSVSPADASRFFPAPASAAEH